MGVVTFAGSTQLVQAPTDDRQALLAAIDRFDLQRGTATGSGLLLSLATLLPEAGIDLEKIVLEEKQVLKEEAIIEHAVKKRK